MTGAISAADRGKLAASLRAVELVVDGMKLGLGTGSTAAWMVRALAARAAREEMRLTCVATSKRTAELATALGLTVTDLDDAGPLDLTIDGADEFDPAFRLIKGGGAAHLREKIVARASDSMAVITDPSKEVPRLGGFPLPVEITPFAHRTTLRHIEATLGGADVGARVAALRMAGDAPVVTDEGNFLVDLALAEIGDPAALDAALIAIPGVVDTGLFIGMCDTIVIGHTDGRAELRRQGQATEVSEMNLSVAAGLPSA